MLDGEREREKMGPKEVRFKHNYWDVFRTYIHYTYIYNSVHMCNLGICINIWLVVWNIWIICPFHIWDVILPIDELIFFKMVKTTNQMRIIDYIAIKPHESQSSPSKPH